MITYTFIIPHHNTPLLLDRCIDSIPCREDIQVIVVDDNSDEDKKPQINRENVELINIDKVHTKGAGKARNEGLKRAQGKWLLFADCDDFYSEGFINILDQYKDQTFDVLYFNFRQEDGSIERISTPLFFHEYFDKFDGSPESIDRLKYHHNVPWTKMVSRDLINKYNIQFEEAINGNDILFSMTVGVCAQNIRVEKAPIYVYLINANSITTKKATIDSALCKFVHNVKINQVYKFVGHPEWVRPFRIYLLNSISSLQKENRLKYVVILLLNSIGIFAKRNEWVSKFKTIK